MPQPVAEVTERTSKFIQHFSKVRTVPHIEETDEREIPEDELQQQRANSLARAELENIRVEITPPTNDV